MTEEYTMLNSLEQNRITLLQELADNAALIKAEKAKANINWECNCHNDEERRETAYEVSLLDRLKAAFEDDAILTDNNIFRYEWNRGYEKLYSHTLGHGSMDYAGVYHPNDGVCEGKGVCIWCGSTLYGDM